MLEASHDRSGARLLFAFLLLLTTPLLVAVEASGQDEIRWRNSTELSFLLSGGNAGASSLGLRNNLRRTTDAGEFRVDASAHRTDAVRSRRFAEGTGPADFAVREEEDRERTAERYSLQTRYDRNLTERLFAFGGVGWQRNTFGGFEHRTVAVTGAGNQWGPGEEAWTLKLGYGITYTVQRDVTPDPERADSFLGARVTLDHHHQFTESVSAEVNWRVDGNAREVSDFRGDLSQSVESALGTRLSLKTTLELLWDNEPPLERIPLFLPGGLPSDQEVLVPLRKLDHNLSIALVVTL